MPDPCINDTNSVDLSTVLGALQADLIVRPGSASDPAPATNDPNGLQVTAAGVWAPPDATSVVGGVETGLPNINLTGTSVPQQDWPSSTVTLVVANPSATRPAAVTILTRAQGRANVGPAHEVGVFLWTRVNSGAWAYPDACYRGNGGTSYVNLSWSVMDLFQSFSLAAGASLTFQAKLQYLKNGATTGGFLEGPDLRCKYTLTTR